MLRHLFLIAYDIASPKRRRKVLDVIKGYACGGQKSLYECWLSTGELQGVLQSVRILIDAGEDRLLIVRLDPRAAVRTIGIAVEPSDGAFFFAG